MMGIVVWIRSRARAGVWGLALAVVGTVAAPGAGSPQPAASIDARIWLDRGSEAVMERGDRARVYYRTSRDAYVAIFRVDTDGTARLVHPRYPGEDHYVRAGREYRLLFPRSSYWHVDDDPGVGYFFLVASATPFDFGRLHWSSTSDAWDLSAVGATVYSDPYVAVDAYVSVLIPGWRRLPYGVHVTEYHVGRSYRYPRFLCYDCHRFRPYHAWNPYHHACRSFRIVIHTRPRYYPIRRYGGVRVVYPTRRVVRRGPRFTFKERADAPPRRAVARPRAGGARPRGGEARPRGGAERPPRVTPPRGTPDGPPARPDRPGPDRPRPDSPARGRDRGLGPPSGVPSPPPHARARPRLERRVGGEPPPGLDPARRPGPARDGGERIGPPPDRRDPPGPRPERPARPSDRVRPSRPSRPTGAGGVARPSTRSGSSGGVRRPSSGIGSRGGSVRRPPSRGRSPAAVRRPPSRGSGSGSSVRRPSSRGGSRGGSVRRPSSRAGSRGGSVRRPPSRGGSSGGGVRRAPDGRGSPGGSSQRPRIRRRPPGG